MTEGSLKQTLAQRYAHLESFRRPYLDRARDCARVTLPYICPFPHQKKLVTPYQGVGAQGVRNLAAKLLLVLLPPNSPFFRLVLDEEVKMQMPDDVGSSIEEALGQLERLLCQEIETGHLRVGVSEALIHLIITGNSLLYLGHPHEHSQSGGSRASTRVSTLSASTLRVSTLRVFHLDSYVIRRDPCGHVMEIITKETLDPLFLPEGFKLPLEYKESSSHPEGAQSVELYTQVLYEQDHWTTRQEAYGMILPDSVGVYDHDKSPWIPLRFIRIDSEDYGRSLVEEYLGDLEALEVLTKAITQGSAAAAKVLFLVRPNSTTREKTLAQAANGAILSGHAEDVSVIQVNKYADFRVAQETMQHITRRLSYAFLVNSAIQRPGERVTAEEIRHMAAELENALGGVYSILSQEFQLPLIRRLMHQMEKAGKMPKLPQDLVRPMIITGLEALGRGHDLMKLQSFVQDVVSLGSIMPDLIQRLDPGELIKRLATARGIDAQDLLRSDEEAFHARAPSAMEPQA